MLRPTSSTTSRIQALARNQGTLATRSTLVARTSQLSSRQVSTFTLFSRHFAWSSQLNLTLHARVTQLFLPNLMSYLCPMPLLHLSLLLLLLPKPKSRSPAESSPLSSSSLSLSTVYQYLSATSPSDIATSLSRLFPEETWLAIY